MSFFPLYVDLKDKKILIVGGGKIAFGKIEVLLPFEPQIKVVSPEGLEVLSVLESHHELTWVRKTYEEEDLEGIYLVIAATASPEVNEEIYRDCVVRGLPVNVVDDPEKCTFIFPAIVKRADLVIGISTSGKYPALSKSIRKKLEVQFPQVYGEILARLGTFRENMMVIIEDPKERKAVLTRVVNELLNPEGEPSLIKLEALISQQTSRKTEDGGQLNHD